MFEDPQQDGPVAGDQDAIDGVLLFRANAAADQVAHQDGDQGHRQACCGGHRVGLGVGQGREQSPFLRLQGKNRHERQGDDQQAGEQGRSDLGRRAGHQLPALLTLRFPAVRLPPVLQMLVCIFDHHHRCIDHRTNGDGDAA